MTKKQLHFHQHGNICEFEFNYLPKFFFIKGDASDKNTYYFWSLDNCNTFYQAYKAGSSYYCDTVNIFSVDDKTIKMTISGTGESWHNVTFEVYALK